MCKKLLCQNFCGEGSNGEEPVATLFARMYVRLPARSSRCFCLLRTRCWKLCPWNLDNCMLALVPWYRSGGLLQTSGTYRTLLTIQWQLGSCGQTRGIPSWAKKTWTRLFRLRLQVNLFKLAIRHLIRLRFFNGLEFRGYLR